MIYKLLSPNGGSVSVLAEDMRAVEFPPAPVGGMQPGTPIMVHMLNGDAYPATFSQAQNIQDTIVALHPTALTVMPAPASSSTTSPTPAVAVAK